MSFEKAKAYLTEMGYEDRIHIFDVSTATVELAAAAVVKFYVGEVDGARKELEDIMDNGSVDGLALAAFIDRAVAYSKGRAQIEELQQVKGSLIVQDIGVDLLDFLMELQN